MRGGGGGAGAARGGGGVCVDRERDVARKDSGGFGRRSRQDAGDLPALEIGGGKLEGRREGEKAEEEIHRRAGDEDERSGRLGRRRQAVGHGGIGFPRRGREPAKREPR